MLVLQKNKKYEAGGKLPYFRLSLAPDKEKGETEWHDIGAFWLKEKNGNKYYTGKLNDDVVLTAPTKEDKEFENSVKEETKHSD
jgi:hypothetical protein